MVYTPSATKEFEKSLQWLSRRFAPRALLQGALRLNVIFYLEKPKTVKSEYPCTKPDLDNFIKAALDALEGIFYKNDSQFVEYRARKRYSSRAGISFGISEIG